MEGKTKEIIRQICSHWICADEEELDRVSRELDEYILNSYENLKKERDELREMLEKVLKDNYNTSWSNANEFSPEGRYGELVPDTRDEIETILNKPQ